MFDRHRLRSAASLVLLLALTGPLPLVAAEGWLPPEVQEGLARQLTDRLTSLPGDHDREEALTGARTVVQGMREVLERGGTDGTLEAAPELPGLVPTTGKPVLDAMGRYQVCNLLLFVQMNDESFRDDPNARLAAIFGMTGVTMAVVHLRQPFLDAGGDVAEVEAHLAGSALQPVLEGIQTDRGVRETVEDACRPTVHGLLEEPLGRLGGSSGGG